MRIAILAPIYRSAAPQYVESLANLIAHTGRARVPMGEELVAPNIAYLMVTSSLIAAARNKLLAEAIKQRFDYALWTDADHVFPQDALVQLLMRGKQVIGCNYPMRGDGRPTAVGLDNERLTSKDREGIEEVRDIGLGFMLMHSSVIVALLNRGPIWPMFKDELKGMEVHGEDAFFCAKLRAAGIPIYVDHDLSKQCGHISETVLRF